MTTLLEARKTGDMILFAHVVDAGTITGGSKRMGLERSTVSRRITSLEDRLGVSLLERSTRRLRLTDVGRQYYQHCLRVVEAAEDAEAAAQGYRMAPSGSLKIAASLCEADKLLSSLITDFIEANDEIRVQLILDIANEERTHPEADLILQCGPTSDARMLSVRIGTLRESLWAGPAYLDRVALDGAPGEVLERAATICLASNEESINWQLLSRHERLEVTIVPRLRVSTLSGCREACLSGLGVACLPDYLCEDFERRGELVRMFSDWQLRGSGLYAIHPVEQFVTRGAKTFIEFAQKKLRQQPFNGMLQ